MADQNNEDVFLAEKVVDSGFGQQDGKRYYKIKWVRYTWESEDTLGHLKELLDSFWSEHERLDHPQTKQCEDTIEVKSQDIDKINALEDASDGIVDGSLAANATVEVGEILKNEEETNELQNTQISENVISLTSHPTIADDDEKIITTSLNQDDGNFDEDSKEVKYIMLEKHACNICLRSYGSLQSLKTHKRSHQCEKSFQCETCFKCFSERSTLKRHMYIHLEEKPFKCEHCERAFSDKSTLRRHIITHTGAKRFHCSSCDKRFTRNEHLRQHNYIHTAQKLYKCDVCQKDFRQRSTLKNHMLLHRAEGGLKCDACGALFSRQLQYDKHVRWCNGNTNEGFKCEFCDKRFPERNGLKRHQLIHSGERPFKCDYCEQSFNDRSILRRHVFTHTERKPFHCSLCEKEFIRKASLLSHMASQHAGQSVFEFVQPSEYEMDDGIPIEDEELEQHVRYVIQTAGTSEDSISQVEVSANDIQNDGVTMLAHAVCNIPQSVMQSTIDNPSMVERLSGNEANKKESSQTLRIQVGQDPGMHSRDNQLLQVQIIRMEDGNQFVQSIQAIVQEEDKDCESQSVSLDTSQVLNANGELTIDTENNCVMTEAMPTHLTISEGINITSNIENIESKPVCGGIDESTIEENTFVSEFGKADDDDDDDDDDYDDDEEEDNDENDNGGERHDNSEK